ncbi:MAG: cyanophycin synthetase [Ectothiorhodospiraceae bacterium]|jgi:dihydrofolate synthase/folylpolyglutamate synthase
MNSSSHRRLLDRLAARSPAGVVPRGAALQSLLAELGDPQDQLRSVQIAGSKGKGSTALYLESVLRASRRRVGVFTSPHLVRWSERFRIDAAEASSAQLDAALEQVDDAVVRLRRLGLEAELGFFDAALAVALVLFRDAGVDVAVLEAGLGGARDATCLAKPAVTCLTSVELEHTAILGNSIVAIATEKAGIARRGVPLVAGWLAVDAARVVRATAERAGAPLVEAGAGYDARVSRTADGRGCRLQFDGLGIALDVCLPVLGAPLAGCAAVALACAASVLPPEDLEPALLARSLASVRLPGRMELARLGGRDFLVDSAHTAESARALAQALRRMGRRAHLVFSLSRDKDLRGFIEPLIPALGSAVVTVADPARSGSPEMLVEQLQAVAPGVACRAEPDVARALDSARERCGQRELVCVAGSVYLAGRARALLGLHNGQSAR